MTNKNFKRNHLFLFFTLVLFRISIAQQVSNVDFEIKDSVMKVRYDLEGWGGWRVRVYDLNLALVDDHGKKFFPRSLTGELKGVWPGRNRKMIWDIFKDTLTLSGHFKAKVEITDEAEVIDKYQRGRYLLRCFFPAPEIWCLMTGKEPCSWGFQPLISLELVRLQSVTLYIRRIWIPTDHIAKNIKPEPAAFTK